MEFFKQFYNAILFPIIQQVVTTDTVIIMVCTLGMTEFTKQGFKHYKNVKSLDNWTIRGISMIFGVFFSVVMLTASIKLRLIYGLFYATIAPVLYWLGKKFIINKYIPSLKEKMSGQNGY